MAGITHTPVVGTAEGSDPTKIRKSNWEADHNIADGTITLAMLAFDVATQVELNALSASLGSAAFTSAGAYEVPLTFSTGLTRIGNTITASGGGGSGTVTSVGLVGTANQVTVTGSSPITVSGSWTLSIPGSAQLSIAKLTNLTSNGLVTTSGGDGTLSVTATSGSGNVVLVTSATLVTPTLGVASATSLTTTVLKSTTTVAIQTNGTTQAVIFGTDQSATFAGFVGIGTTSTPAELLQIGIGNSTSARAALTFASGGLAVPPVYTTNSVGDKIIFYKDGNNRLAMGVDTTPNLWFQAIGTGSTAAIKFVTGSSGAGTEAGRFAGNGRFGVGTTTPGAGIEVAGAAGTAANRFRIKRTDSTTASGIFEVVGSDDAVAWSYGVNQLVGDAIELNENGTTNRLTVIKGGNVGIGQTVPTARLELLAAANTIALKSTGYFVTSTGTLSMFDLAGTLNGTGIVDVLKLSVTNTATNAASKLLNLYAGASGTTSVFSVAMDGSVFSNRSVTVNNDGDYFRWLAPGNIMDAVGASVRMSGTYGIRGNSAFKILSGAMLGFNSDASDPTVASDLGLSRDAARVAQLNNGTAGTFGDLKLRNLLVQSGGQISMTSTGGAAVIGNATLVGGSVTVSTTAAVTGVKIFLQRKASGGTIGTALTYTISSGTSFTINSDNVLDTSTVDWWIAGAL